MDNILICEILCQRDRICLQGDIYFDYTHQQQKIC